MTPVVITLLAVEQQVDRLPTADWTPDVSLSTVSVKRHGAVGAQLVDAVSTHRSILPQVLSTHAFQRRVIRQKWTPPWISCHQVGVRLANDPVEEIRFV